MSEEHGDGTTTPTTTAAPSTSTFIPSSPPAPPTPQANDLPSSLATIDNNTCIRTIPSLSSGLNGGNNHINNHHDLYKSIDLKPGHIREVVIINNDPKSVLTWDFDVVKSDLHFTVFRTTKSLSHFNGNFIYNIIINFN